MKMRSSACKAESSCFMLLQFLLMVLVLALQEEQVVVVGGGGGPAASDQSSSSTILISELPSNYRWTHGQQQQQLDSTLNLTRHSFPPGFVFGTATSAYQVEGAVKQDGRQKSIWDTFSHRLGNVLDLSNGDTTDDHYNRYKAPMELSILKA